MDASSASFGEERVVLEPSEAISVALRRAEEALEAARNLGERATLAEALVGVARLRFRLGQYEAARALGREALTIAAPNTPVRADAWQVLGNCAAETDSLAEAEVCYRVAADLAREAGYQRAQMAALHGLAVSVYLPRGQFDLALAAEQEVQAIASRQGRPEWLVYPLTALALIYQQSGQREKAREALDELGHLVTTGSIVQGYQFCISAGLYLDQGELEAARTLCAQARSIAEASGEPWLNISVRLGMSRYHRLAGDGPNSRGWADDALAFARRVGYQHEQGKALIERARAAWLCGDETAAEADLRAAVELLERLGAAFDLTRARFLLAALLHRQNHPEAVSVWLEAARSVLKGGYAFLLDQDHALAYSLIVAYLNGPDPLVAQISARCAEYWQHVPPPPLRIITLGRFEVWQGARRVDPRSLRRRYAGELLALLLLAPSHSLLFDQVADELWRDKAPAAAQTLFHQATSALRRALEPELPERFRSRYVLVEGGRVSLRLPPGSTIDFQTFEKHYRAQEWEAAINAYHGDLLPDDLYADWSIVPRERLKRLYLHALLARARQQMEAKHPHEVLAACYRALEIDSWQEEAVWLGMQACLALHDRAGAIRLYQTLERTLRQELNTTPAAPLRRLYEQCTSEDDPQLDVDQEEHC